VVALPQVCVDALARQRQTQDADRSRAGRRWHNPNDLVFTTESGTPLDPSNVRRRLQHVADRAGLDHLHPHLLRHAAASLLSAAGVPLEQISDLLGHRSVTVTAEVYRHSLSSVRSGHLEAMADLTKSSTAAEHND
jgi:integrase